jgi:hypothetical protein
VVRYPRHGAHRGKSRVFGLILLCLILEVLGHDVEAASFLGLLGTYGVLVSWAKDRFSLSCVILLYQWQVIFLYIYIFHLLCHLSFFDYVGFV